MTEIHNFYANLYDKDTGSIPSDEFLKSINSKMLTDEQPERLDTTITITEYFEALKSFQKNKMPGNDGLTIEFYLAFWDLVDALTFVQEKGQLSTSQKQAMINPHNYCTTFHE